MAHVVILGGGIGGTLQAFELREVLAPEHRITVVSDRPYFQFTPSNPWAGVGWRRKDDITVELAPVLRDRDIGFICDGATALAPEGRRLSLRSGREVNYDYLVIATGPELAFDEIEGFGPGAGTQSVCTIDHAERSSAEWEAFCADPGPIVVGAVQGASCFGPAYEYAMVMDTDLRRRGIRNKVPMTFVTPEPYIGHLGLDGVGDTKGMLESLLRDHDIRWITNAKVERFADGTAHVVEHDDTGAEKRRHELPYSYSMLLPAFRGIPALQGIDGLVNPRGFVITDDYQRNPKYPEIFGIGVAIAIAPPRPTPVACGVPKTGFMIETMVNAIAKNLPLIVAGKGPVSIPTWNALCLADFGNRGAAFLAMPQIPPRNVNWSSEGRWVHWAKLAYEWYFLRKVRRGVSEPIYERLIMKYLRINKIAPPTEKTGH